MTRQAGAKKPEGIFASLERGSHNWGDLARSSLLAQGLEPGVVAAALPGITIYLREVLRWGSRVDLIAPSSLDEFLDLSLADAAALAKSELSSSPNAHTDVHWVDVGSGGGAPGIPLALLLQAGGRLGRLTLVEPRDKRVAFLRSVVGQLGLPLAQVVRSRSDALSDNFADVAVARATLPPAEWVLEGARLARQVWVLLAREAAPAPPLGWELHADISYKWAATGRERRALLYRVGPAFPELVR
jgi:16S rRNA G527 N7-methylase RsmG